jgi:hypothetical protein
MKNGKPSLIFDIRYFSGHRHSYLHDHSVTAYGRRLAWYLNSQGLSLGPYHSLYVHFTSATPTGEIEIDSYKGGDELWWLRYVHVGVASDFPNVDNANETAMRGTVAALRILSPNADAIIEQADIIVRQHAGDLRFLVGEMAYKRYTLKIAATIAVHPEPSHLYATLLENATGVRGETQGLPIGFYANAFDEARSISLRDFDIDHSSDGLLKVDWCERIRKGWAAAKPTAPDQPEPIYSQLVRRQ